MPTRRSILVGPALATLALVRPGRSAAQVPEWSLRAQQRLSGGPGADFAERQRLLREGEARLASGDAEAAEPLFDRAAAMLHAADTEIALVRTYMQLGQYRRAMAFCAHTAGVHRDVVSAAALYVWLLHAGGQARVAAQRLAEAEALYPGEALLAAVRARTGSPWPRAEGPLRELPARMAPYAVQAGAQPAAGARVVGSATLLPDGGHALAPAAALPANPSGVWVRNGTGQASAARSVHTLPGLALTLLRLDVSLPTPVAPGLAARDPFAGQPGYAVEFAEQQGSEPDWPLLRLGFLGAVGRAPAARRLGLEVPPGPRGGPVLDANGQWVGVAVPGSAPAQMVQGSELRATLGELLGAPAAAATRVAPDLAYERGLRLALQLLT